eukprot:808508-Rhodomonas_salina.3
MLDARRQCRSQRQHSFSFSFGGDAELHGDSGSNYGGGDSIYGASSVIYGGHADNYGGAGASPLEADSLRPRTRGRKELQALAGQSPFHLLCSQCDRARAHRQIYGALIT